MKKLVLLLLLLSGPAHAQDRLTPELLWKLGRVSDAQVSPDGQWVVYGVTTYDIAENRGNTDLWLVPAAGGAARRITSFAGNETNARWRPDGRRIGFLATEGGSQQLWEMNPDGSGQRKVSDIEGGIANFLWAPTGTHVSFTRDVKLDTTIAERHPDLPKAEARLIDGLMYRHWNYWHGGTYSHLLVAEYRDGALVGAPRDVMAGEPYHTPLPPFGGVEHIAWSPDGRHIAYTSKKQRGTEAATSTDSDIYLHEVATGRTTNISQGMTGYDTEPAFSPDGRHLAWTSMERPGYEADRNRIFVRDLASGERRELTAGFDPSAQHPRWSPDSRTLYFLAAREATIQLFALDLQPRRGQAAIRQVTQGLHDLVGYDLAQARGGRPVIVATRMSMSQPPEVFRIDPGTGEGTQLTFTNRSLLEGVRLGRVEKRMIPSSDGQPVLTWVIYPPDFDPSRAYPALLFAQGGPQSSLSQFFSFRWNFQLMAANGYIVIAPNRRGVTGIGQSWTDAIRGEWGGQAMRDLLAATDTLAREPYVDETRLGAVGASFGGFTVYWLAGNHEKRFKAFISHAGVFNLESMYGATEEMFFVNQDMEGPYWQTPVPKSYERFSPHRFVARWDTPILITHGELDFRVPVDQGMQAFTAAQLRGIPSRMLLFPNEGHWIGRPQNALLWQRTFFEWLDRWLKPGKAVS